MEQVKYYMVVTDGFTRERPRSVLRRSVREGVERDEVYKFYRDGRHGWEFSDFFVRELFGQNDDKEHFEVTQDEAEAAIERRIRERESRGIG
ncbi:hypothetical protein, partial [Glycomyces sp. NRRL B-16210]|uniref:hypothetical protein n=1 Tax=Glycomyces sp. NRRL B-16210 TaxID=1463821 RepID=UPI0004C1064C